tara:strand:- start:601 stop:1044 length:444 start_codon:yes stop_codon:yes gene_type:complete
MGLPTSLVLSASLLAGFALGCGGSKKPAEQGSDDVVVAPVTDAQAEESPEEKFARQKADAVGKMCERLIDCSVEEAKSQLPPEELAKLDLENTSKKALAECNDAYSASPMSPRQVVSLRECLGQPTECPEFNSCLEKLSSPAETETP